MSYEDAAAHLEGLGIDAMKKMRPNTARIEAICEALNNPERATPALHITGTNGKTSTARIAASVLAATGLSVGTYTSPHLQRVNERIMLNGESLGDEAFGDVFDHLKPYIDHVESQLGEGLTYFEVLTAMFFLWAAETVDAMVVEVGLGGRWDATNVVDGSVAVITNVGLDHTGLLGKSREVIAEEKAGIIKADSSVVTAERTPSVLAVIAGEAERVGASTTAVLGRDFTVSDNRIAVGGRYLSLSAGTGSYEGLFLPLHGAHQGVNAAVAVEAVTRFLPKPIEQEIVEEGFLATSVPGRLETVHLEGDDAVPVVIDVAHNPDGMAALVNSLVEAFAFERALFVVGILGDKDYEGMLREIARVPCALYLTAPQSVRSVEVERLERACDELGLECWPIEDVAKAVEAAVGATRAGDLVCITGSHYVAGEARSELLGG